MTPTVVGEIGGSFGLGAIAVGAVQLFGLPLPAVAWGFVGGIIGTGFTPPMGKWMAVLTYCAASLLSAGIGFTTATHFTWTPEKGYMLGGLISAVFHPCLNLLVQKLPSLFASLPSPFGKRI